MDGVLNILKPPGLSSHDVVAYVRRVMKTKRVGHTGTLDPAASGVLPICVGQATRLVEYLQAGRKTYLAEAAFGLETDTLDAVGQITRRADASGLRIQDIERALEPLRGDIEQLPPAYSAIKIAGRKGYEMARGGEDVEIPVRRVSIFALEMVSFTPGAVARARLRLECSGGTYVRSLVRDVGQSLGCGATMSFLVRERSGLFGIGEALTLDEVEEAKLWPLMDALRACACREVVSDALTARLVLGQKIVLPELNSPPELNGPTEAVSAQRVLVRSQSGLPAALVLPDDASATARGGGHFRPEKVFPLAVA
jgi:tRNA pseudouridine55 synthase